MGKSVPTRTKKIRKNWDWPKWRLRQASTHQNKGTCWRFPTPGGLWYLCAIPSGFKRLAQFHKGTRADHGKDACQRRWARQREAKRASKWIHQPSYPIRRTRTPLLNDWNSMLLICAYCNHWYTAPVMHVLFLNTFPSVTGWFAATLVTVYDSLCYAKCLTFERIWSDNVLPISIILSDNAYFSAQMVQFLSVDQVNTDTTFP